MGEQTWSRPLQRLIAAQADITPIRPQLLGDAATALAHLANFYQQWAAATGATGGSLLTPEAAHVT